MTVNKKYPHEPDYAVPPGETLESVLKEIGMPKKVLADRIELTPQSVSRIIRGILPISVETAKKLERVLDIPASLWLSLEAQYREQLLMIDELKKQDVRTKWLESLPMNLLFEMGYVDRDAEFVEQVEQLFRFFGVGSVQAWKKLWENPQLAARRSSCFETDIAATSVWIRIAELQARKIACEPFSKRAFLSNLKKVKKLTMLGFDQFFPKMVELCARSGVALVLNRTPKKVPWSGASKWLSQSKALIVITLRGKREDRFWFSFFHEAAHIINDPNGENALYLNYNEDNSKIERRADEFAAEFMIPRSYDDLIRYAIDGAKLEEIAHELGISVGIVAGRYRYLTEEWHKYNDLIRKFEYA